MVQQVTTLEEYALREPLSVSIIDIEGHFYATNREIEICADGNSADEALNNFKIELERLYNLSKRLMSMFVE